jgi:hypothetical protein
MPDTARTADAVITEEVASWPGVEVRPHRFGGVAFMVGRRELGHLHGDRLADLPMTRARRAELMAAGRVEPHHALPDSGWASRRIRTDDDASDVIALLRGQYERATAR